MTCGFNLQYLYLNVHELMVCYVLYFIMYLNDFITTKVILKVIMSHPQIIIDLNIIMIYLFIFL